MPASTRVLIVYEQGFGDTIHFCRYAERLSHVCAQVMIGTQKPLERLLRASFAHLPNVQVLTQTPPLDAVDAWQMMMSLPFAFDDDVNTLPAPRAYLQASAATMPPGLRARLERLGRRLPGGCLHVFTEAAELAALVPGGWPASPK